MNSLASYDWLKQYADLKKITPDEFARRMSLSGPAVEKIIPQGAGLEKVVVGHVIEVKPHPNADKLRLAVTDIGSRQVTIVCGGSNLMKDQWVAVALVGAKVKWHGEGEPIVLEPIEIRGVASEGMICAANEIGLFDAFPHADREILDLGVMIPGLKMKAGTPLADALGLSDDVVMDIEVTTNRVDAMGMVGMAREASAILDVPFTWKPSKPVKVGKNAMAKISAKKLCPRYMAAKIEGVKVGPSPWWLRRRLASAGLNSINNLVDISNFVMLELAQPTHVFDANTFEGSIDVRLARAGEKIEALDGKTYELDDTILVIADKKNPIAVAGVIGGKATGVSDATTDVIVEAANFDEVIVRKGARKLNIQTDAQQRFEKGLSNASAPIALARMVELILEVAGGKVVSATDVGETKYKPVSYSVTTDEANSLIGVTKTQKEMVTILRRLGFIVKTTGKKITARVPWWRDKDIESGRDLVEEIARVEGYANIPAIFPVGLANRPRDPELMWEKHVRCISKGAGMTETYTYSFISKALAKKAGYDPERMLAISNPLSSDFEVMRTSLLPSLLEVAAQNQERFSEERLFEVANVYYPSEGNRELPAEELELGGLFMGMKEPWREAKGYVEHLFDTMGISEIAWRRLQNDSFWHGGRSVQAFSNGKLIATVGEVSPTIAKNFKLDGRVALVDMPLEHVIKQASHKKQYIPIPAFPEAKRDLAVVVDRRAEYDDVAREIRRADPLIIAVEWFDTYEGKNLPEGKKSLGMHLTFSHADRTLESKEVDAAMEKAILSLKEHFKAEVRG
ncbi:phenylalanine--tRNA ligase subunit beta [Patescibacteria group bacterium]|nr:phenylalanine--tRNA ligase subunit beta [Patescibacteria group bacterium]